MEFQIDTGAEVTVISERDFKRLGEVTLLPSQRILRGPNQTSLSVKGQFSGKLRVGKRATEQTIYVVGLHKSLLGKPAIQALQLLKRTGAVEKGSKPEELFPNLFTGLGKLEGEYTIRQRGWPSIKKIPQALKKFYQVAAELSVQKGLLLRGSRLVIPVSMQSDILNKLHVGHQGIRKCRERAKQAVWWPSISKQLEKLVNECPNCIKF